MEVQYANSSLGKWLSQSFWFSLKTLASSVQLNLSTCQFSCEWYAVVLVRSMPNCLHKLVITSLFRLGPWSLWRYVGTPYWHTISSSSSLARVSESVTQRRKASNHMLNKSVITTMYLCPFKDVPMKLQMDSVLELYPLELEELAGTFGKIGMIASTSSSYPGQ